MVALYRRLFLLCCLSQSHLIAYTAALNHQLTPSRHFAFASTEEAATERRHGLPIEPPLHAVHGDPSSPPPQREPNVPRLLETTSTLVGPRLSLHIRVHALIRSSDLDDDAVSSRVRPTVFTGNAIAASMVRSAHHDDAVALFAFFFHRSSIVPNVVSYHTIILAHYEAARVDDALWEYQEMLDGVTSFSSSAAAYRQGLAAVGRIQDVLDHLRDMLSRGQGAESLVYKNLIDGYIHLDDWEKAFELFAELQEKTTVYDDVVHTSFMEGY